MQNGSSSAHILDPQAAIGAVTLKVQDFPRMLTFYQEIIGLTPLSVQNGIAELGVQNRALVRLLHYPNGVTAPRATGLFHLALLLPDRAELGSWLTHLANSGYPLDGAGDHLVSEALYLSDPEGNGIEIYTDRPRAEWHYRDGRVLMDTLPVDLPALMNEAGELTWQGMPGETRMGHVHLCVNHLDKAMAFYRDVLGFDTMAAMPGAGFMGTGGYHHHIGLNTWRSNGAAPLPEEALGLHEFSIILPDAAALQRLRDNFLRKNIALETGDGSLMLHDPAGIAIRLGIKE